MSIFFVTFGVMLLVVAGMAIGVILSNREIKGSCGGMQNIDGVECGTCEKPCEKRRKLLAEQGVLADNN